MCKTKEDGFMKVSDLSKLVNDNEVVELLQKMIKIETVNPPGNEESLAKLLYEEMKSFGMEAEIVKLQGERANVVGRLRGSGERQTLLFNGHLDTVPPGEVKWEFDPFEAVISNNRVYGRGSADMKSGLAAMIIAAKAIKKSGLQLKGDLVVSCTAGEETDSIGAHDFVNKGGLENVGAIVIGEPSSCGINIAEKGALWLEITTYGKTAHGAFPDRGINAISHMNALLSELFNYKLSYEVNELLGSPTMNISTIHGGVKTNVVPDKCSITIDIRTIPGINHDDLIVDIQRIIDKIGSGIENFKAEMKVLNNRPAVETPKDNPFVKLAQKVIKEQFDRHEEPKGVNFYTDASVFLPAKEIPAIFYGPGDADMAHQPNEFVCIDRLHEATQFYYELIRQYLLI
jgi:succinyl-diaminopimelate desuccinylase